MAKQRINLLDGVTNKTSPLVVSMAAFLKNIARFSGIKQIPLVATDDEYDKQDRGNDIEEYPYAFMRMTNIEFILDRQNTKAAARHGYPIADLNDPDAIVTNAAIPKQFLFPVRVSLEMTYKTNQFSDVITIIEKMCLLSISGTLTFKVHAPMYPEITNIVKLESPSVPITPAEINSSAEPGAHKLTFNFTLESYSGIFKDVPKINNEGKVTTNIEVKT